MKKPIAILVTGHSHWGKSVTLKALTEGRLPRSYTLAGHTFFVRRMSNDDFTEGYKDFIDSHIAKQGGDLIAAFCPHFDTGDTHFSEHVIKNLKSKYRVIFFVLKYQYGTANHVTDKEISTLKGYGDVIVYDKQRVEAQARASALKDCIKSI